MLFGFLPLACGGGLDRVSVRQDSSDHRPAVPDTTIERLRECVADHGGQLEPGRYYLNTHVRVDREGVNQGASTVDVPQTSPGLTACMRVVLREMAVPEAILQAPPTEDAAARMNRSFMGSPAVVVVVAVGLSEIVLEAGAVTILFAVTVEVVNEAGKDIAEAVRRRKKSKKDVCTEHYTKCMDKALASKDGNTWRQTRCGICRDRCDFDEAWPAAVGNGTCDYNSWPEELN
ncbi:hypothetical protein [Polyangium aurulentum]|uniref:hypothetical protein n=1 Tax=Polyangium aurulentum TaxID=2567896 RepID=UPI00197FBD33|nr:hypothetical protein [Polyangium aurulentum]UQA63441.1 hypothetical protein E8A73_024395 [Polyangium aurulentum]